MIADELPDGWRVSSLGKLNSAKVGTLNPADYLDEDFAHYSIPAYRDGTRPGAEAGREIMSQKLLIPDKCLLFGKLNPRVEKVWKVDNQSNRRAIASTEWLPIVPGDDLDLSFGYFLLWSDWVMPIAKSLTSGSTPSRQRVEPASFYQIEVPLPPLPEQLEIAAMLSRLQSAVAAQDDLIETASELKRAAMLELFARGLRGEAQKDSEIGPVPNSWSVQRLGSLGKIGGGTTPNRSKSEFWDGGTIPWITSGKMYEREIWGSEVYITPLGLKANSLPLLKPGALLIAIVGQGKTLGHCAVLRTEATISRHVGYFQPDEKVTMSGYVRGYLESIYDNLRQLASGNGSTRAALTAAILRDIPVPVPPTLEEQAEINSIFDAIDAKIDLHQRKRAVLEELFRALLHKLMTGEVRVADLDLSAMHSHQEVAA